MGFNSAFKGLSTVLSQPQATWRFAMLPAYAFYNEEFRLHRILEKVLLFTSSSATEICFICAAYWNGNWIGKIY